MKTRIKTAMLAIVLCPMGAAIGAESASEVRALAKEAFIYAYPMLYKPASALDRSGLAAG